MTRILPVLARLAGAALVVAVMAACGSGGGGPPAVKQGLEITIAPTAPTVDPNAQVVFTVSVTGALDTSVTWSVSQGCGTVNSSGLYTAPSAAATCTVTVTSNADPTKSAVAVVTVRFRSSGGAGVDEARPFAGNSPWNTPTPAATRWFDTAVLHVVPGGGFRHWWVSTDLGITWSLASDPVWTFNLPAYSADLWHRTRPAATIQMHAPQMLAPRPSGGDRIVIVADSSTGDYVEVWNTTVDRSTMTVTGPVWATGNMISGLGVGDLTTNLNAGVRASNFSWAAGLITQADLTAGKIDHALAVALPPDMTRGGSPPVGPYRAPATAGNGDWPTGPIVMGSKIGIPAGIPRPAGLSPIGVMVFESLQQYGAYVGDVCGAEEPSFYADGPSMGLAPSVSIDFTPFDPLVAYWNYGGSADMEKIGPLLRIADYQP